MKKTRFVQLSFCSFQRSCTFKTHIMDIPSGILALEYISVVRQTTELIGLTRVFCLKDQLQRVYPYLQRNPYPFCTIIIVRQVRYIAYVLYSK